MLYLYETDGPYTETSIRGHDHKVCGRALIITYTQDRMVFCVLDRRSDGCASGY